MGSQLDSGATHYDFVKKNIECGGKATESECRSSGCNFVLDKVWSEWEPSCVWHGTTSFNRYNLGFEECIDGYAAWFLSDDLCQGYNASTCPAVSGCKTDDDDYSDCLHRGQNRTCITNMSYTQGNKSCFRESYWNATHSCYDNDNASTCTGSCYWAEVNSYSCSWSNGVFQGITLSSGCEYVDAWAKYYRSANTNGSLAMAVLMESLEECEDAVSEGTCADVTFTDSTDSTVSPTLSSIFVLLSLLWIAIPFWR